jgi:hypothetical protein
MIYEVLIYGLFLAPVPRFYLITGYDTLIFKELKQIILKSVELSVEVDWVLYLISVYFLF